MKKIFENPNCTYGSTFSEFIWLSASIVMYAHNISELDINCGSMFEEFINENQLLV